MAEEPLRPAQDGAGICSPPSRTIDGLREDRPWGTWRPEMLCFRCGAVGSVCCGMGGLTSSVVVFVCDMSYMGWNVVRYFTEASFYFSRGPLTRSLGWVLSYIILLLHTPPFYGEFNKEKIRIIVFSHHRVFQFRKRFFCNMSYEKKIFFLQRNWNPEGQMILRKFNENRLH